MATNLMLIFNFTVKKTIVGHSDTYNVSAEILLKKDALRGRKVCKKVGLHRIK